MKDHFKIDTRPVAREESVLRGEKYRISILTPWLIRLEYSESGRFEDRPTQCVWNREFPAVQFEVRDEKDVLRVTTEESSLSMIKAVFRQRTFVESTGKYQRVQQYLAVWRKGDGSAGNSAYTG